MEQTEWSDFIYFVLWKCYAAAEREKIRRAYRTGVLQKQEAEDR